LTSPTALAEATLIVMSSPPMSLFLVELLFK